MSPMRVVILAVVVGVAMVMPTPMAAWAGQQAQKVAKQEKSSEKKATQNKGDKTKEKEPGKKEKKSTGSDAKPEKEGKKEKEGKQEEKKAQKEKESEKTGEDKVTLCHKSSDTSEKAHSITVGAAALDAHLAHGDTEGPCVSR